MTGEASSPKASSNSLGAKSPRKNMPFDESLSRNIYRAHQMHPDKPTHQQIANALGITLEQARKYKKNFKKAPPSMYSLERREATKSEDDWAIIEARLLNEMKKPNRPTKHLRPFRRDEIRDCLIARFTVYEPSYEQVANELDPKRSIRCVRTKALLYLNENGDNDPLVLEAMRMAREKDDQYRAKLRSLGVNVDQLESKTNIDFKTRPWKKEEGEEERFLSIAKKHGILVASIVMKQSIRKCHETFRFKAREQASADQDDKKVCTHCKKTLDIERFIDSDGSERKQCQDCLTRFRKYMEDYSVPIDSFLNKAADTCMDNDVKRHPWMERVYDDPLERDLIKDLVDEAFITCVYQYQGCCKYCQRALVFQKGVSFLERRAASLDHLDPDLPGSHPDQTLQFVCIACNVAKDNMKEDEYKEFIRLVQAAPTDFQAIPLKDNDRQSLRSKYHHMVTADKDRAEKHETMGETCSLQDLAILAECNGRMCTSTNLEGSFDGSSVPPYLLQSFNRVYNFYGDLHQQHHIENLEVILFICNRAMGPSTPVELDNWIKAIRVSTYPTDE